MATQELKRLAKIAVPMAVVAAMQFAVQTVTSVMVGHLHSHSQLYLSASSLAFVIAKVTAYNFQVGMSGALETLGGQAYGGRRYKLVGLLTQTTILSQLLLCVPISVAWTFMDKLLILGHQDPTIAVETGKYMRWMLPSLFSQAINQSLVRYFQCQSSILPMMVSTLVSSCVHVLVSWLLMFKFGLGFLGSALAVDISCLIQLIILVLFVKYSSACANTRIGFSANALKVMPAFFRLAVPSALMLCLGYWPYQAIILMAGLLHNPNLEISVVSLGMTTLDLLGQIPFGISCGVSTRVSNELGAGNPVGARAATLASILVVVIEMAMATLVLFFARRSIGHLYTKDSQVVAYFVDMTPLVCAALALDSLIYVFIGIVRGCGLQKLVTYINLGAYFLCGIPISVVLGFVFHLGGRGLWWGVILGAAIQTISVAIYLSFTNWDKQVLHLIPHNRKRWGKWDVFPKFGKFLK